MESGRKIEAGESNTHPSSSTGPVGLSIPSKKLSSSLSSASNSSSDSSFELTVNESGLYIGGSSDSLKKNELHIAGHLDSDFEFINGDYIKTRPPMEPDLNKTLPGARLGGADNFESRKNLQTCSSTSSSSVSESESEHKIKLRQGVNASDKLLSNNPSSPSMEKDNRLAVNFSNDDVPITSMAHNGQSPVIPTRRIDSTSSGSEAATQYPTTQMMERAENPTSPAYRIPSHVFSRTKSTAPTEWSAASNESLFSIQMGNMSFTREQLCWLGKSGELYRPGELALDVSQPLNMKHSEYGLKGTHPDGDVAATEARSAETMREVIRENIETQRKGSSTLTESSSQSASLSHQSEGSTKSFQFPILTGDEGKSISFKGGEPEKVNRETNRESPQSASNPQISKESSSDESPKAVSNEGPKRWLSCFSCCPFCS